MKVITLIQPWATLIALGEKTIETRSWSTNYRGTIAIHAGKKIDKSVFNLPYYKEIFLENNITADNIITSSIICTCDIADVKPTEELISIISEKEIVFGNYSPDRFGWILNNIKPITPPITKVKGMLGFWNYKVISFASGDFF